MTSAQILEIMYVLTGLVSVVVGLYGLKTIQSNKRYTTAAFWILLGITFIFGKVIPANIIGAIILIMGVLTAIKGVVASPIPEAPVESRLIDAKKYGSKLFIPAITIGVVAFIFGQYIPSMGALVGLGAGALIATIMAILMTRVDAKTIPSDTSRLLLQMGATAILPQLLSALGALFAKAGVGEVIAQGIGSFIPMDTVFWGVVAYCVGMAVFTMIMGNGFAAFAVITAGIGIPFVYSQGADPAIAGALALTAGFCGTLMTPMAANFNIIPAAILEAKNQNTVIKNQFALALVLLVIHIGLMYFWAF